MLSGFGVQELVGDHGVERLRHSRREDLVGRPLVWQAALQNLVAQLTAERQVAAR